MRRREKNKGGSLLVQLGVVVGILFALTTFVNGFFTWRMGNNGYMTMLQEDTARILAQVRSDMEKYDSLPWLLDYWQGHWEEMDLTGSAKARDAEVAALLAELGVADPRHVSNAQAAEFTEARQRQFAEYCYLDIHQCFRDIKANMGMESLYCASYSTANATTAFPILQGLDDDEMTANENSYALGAEWPFDLSRHPAILESLSSGEDRPFFETVAFVGDGVDRYVGYLPVIVNGEIRCHICVTYTMAGLQEAIAEEMRGLELANAVIMVVSAAVLLVLGRRYLRKLAQVQDEVRTYRTTKDVDAIVSGLAAVQDNNEVGRLAGDIADMAVELDRHAKETARLSAERERIDTELELAAQIQGTSLPNVFPPFPERRDFGLFASMDAAREVGGDFYDYFLVDDNHLAVIVADVSDKGVPAALYMMRAKAAIKDLLMSDLAVDDVCIRANNELCTGNDAGMFVTAWLGVLNLRTGVMKYVHAGHTCPVLLNGANTTFVKGRRDLFLGARAGLPYHRQMLQLAPGDALFLYSDGVTEAFNAGHELYGSEGLERALSAAAAAVSADDPNEYCREVCVAVRDDVAAFAKGTEQSDDITMLCICYKG
ncbi:MAG: serine/threonine-protein phosphatase [Atopobiaceae bacterium]|nr:serine/threonine-protein phosphatase [Atopobiaceae bacterium]